MSTENRDSESTEKDAETACVAENRSVGDTEKSPQTPPTKRQLSCWRKLAFLGVVLTLLFGLVEAMLIALGIAFPLLYQPDEYCATRLKSHLNVRYIEEGAAIVRTNSAGFRDEEWSKEKKKGEYRIAVIGDSFCEAIQVPREKSLCYLLEQKLVDKGINANVLNFGVSGFGTAQEFEMLRHYVLDYKPDLVILGVFLGNDVGDNSRLINPGQIKPYYDLVDGKLQLDDSFRDSPEFKKANSQMTRFKSGLINTFRSLQLANKLYVRMKAGRSKRANVEIGLDPQLYTPPQSQEWKDAWTITESLVKAFHVQCDNAGAKCVVLTLSNPIQVHPFEESRRQFKERHGIESLFYPDDRLISFCSENQISCFQISRTLFREAAGSDPPVYFHGFKNTEMGTGHWNEQGHSRVSELLSNYLLEQNIVAQ